MNSLYIYKGVISFKMFKLSLFLLPALLIGIYLGSKVHHKIDEVLFKKIVAVILFVVGITFLFSKEVT